MARTKTNDWSLTSGKGMPSILLKGYFKHILLGYDMGYCSFTSNEEDLRLKYRHESFLKLMETDKYIYQPYDYNNHSKSGYDEYYELVKMINSKDRSKQELIAESGIYFYISLNELIKWLWIGYYYGATESSKQDIPKSELISAFIERTGIIKTLQIEFVEQIWDYWLLDFIMYKKNQNDINLYTQYIFGGQDNEQPHLSRN